MNIEILKEDEMELSLELSIGGCYKRIEKSRNHENENGKIHDIDENNPFVSESNVVGYVHDGICSSDSGKKREIQALRRREAIKKREEKQKRWARSRGVNERIHLEIQQTHARVMDRGRRENASSEEFSLKKNKVTCNNKCFKVIQNGSNCGDLNLEHRNKRMVSNGLIERSSYAFLDYQSISTKAGSSSTDSGSHSNNSQGGQRQLSTTATSTTSERSDLNGPSSLLQSDQANEQAANLLRTMSSPKIPTPECSNPKKCEPINKPMPTPKEQTSSSSSQCKEAVIKPSMPQSNNRPLPRMPLVSTTGNCPNGKTVNGFLYNYSKTEVNIVCVCHGCSFSPAKFVEHAGGIDISHPLKHITIVPTPFG